MTRVLTAVGFAFSIWSVLWFGYVVTHAQVLDPMYSVPSYTTDDPIDPARLGLATPDGRFAIVPQAGCDWLAAGQEVNLYPNAFMQPILGLSGIDGSAPSCQVYLEGRMSTTPCFAGPDGNCDVAQELDP